MDENLRLLLLTQTGRPTPISNQRRLKCEG